ncbi:hypothetical protein PHYC_03906 [Phycisphaerales bacterium]|nr:hypothetical protein PHYC_03906 [Phycisphaerales bacterium]
MSLPHSLLLALLPLPALAQPCGQWQPTPTPNVGNSVTRLTSISALSQDDAWAAGLWRNNPTGEGPVIIHWNGAAWNLADLPSSAHLGTSPQVLGVDAAPNGDVWFAGYLTTTYPTNNMPLVLRWRNGGWDHVGTVSMRPQREYPYGPRGGFLYDVAALAPNDAWAVGIGAGYGDATSSSVPLAAHWDGSSWTDVEVPLVANRHHELGSVLAISSDDVWAIGDYRNISGTFRGITYHWDGTRWSHIQSPIEAVSQSGLEDIAATGPNDVWAIGGSDAGVFLMHWDGSAWTEMPPPPNSGGSIAAVGPDDLWVSGWSGYWHWDGSTWTEVPTTVPGSTYVIRSGGMEVIGNCDLWGAGFWTLEDGITSFTLAERLIGEPTCDPDVNCDGTVNGFDIEATEQAVNGDFSNFCLPSADLNGDGAENGFDIETEEQRVNGAPC